MNETLTKRSLSSLIPLLLFAVFAVCILMVLLSGANIYKKTAKRDQDSIQQRTLSQYLTTRLHQSDAEGMVFVGDFGSAELISAHNSTDAASADALTRQPNTLTGDTLYLREELNDRIYYTRIYVHEGMLRELFAAEGLTFAPSEGKAILPLKELTFTLQNQLLTIKLTHEDGTGETLLIALRNSASAEKEGTQ